MVCQSLLDCTEVPAHYRLHGMLLSLDHNTLCFPQLPCSFRLLNAQSEPNLTLPDGYPLTSHSCTCLSNCSPNLICLCYSPTILTEKCYEGRTPFFPLLYKHQEQIVPYPFQSASSHVQFYRTIPAPCNSWHLQTGA